MSEEKKKSFSSWNVIWVIALVMVGVNRYKKNKVLKGPYAPQVKAYQDFQSKVASKRFAFIRLRENPPKTIAEQDKMTKKLGDECQKLPKPSYRFQEKVFSSMLDWCSSMYDYKSYIFSAVEKGLPEKEIASQMDLYLKKMVGLENFMIDGMDKFPSNSDFVEGLKQNQYQVSEVKAKGRKSNSLTQLERSKLSKWVKGQSFVFNGLIQSVVEQDKAKFERFSKQHHKGCELVIKDKRINSEIDKYCKSSTLAVRKIASLENRKNSVNEVNKIVEASLTPLKNITNIIKFSK